MTERQDRNRLTARSERDIDRLFRPLARAVSQAVRRHGQITPLAYVLIMRDVDAALDRVFGRYPGDREAPLYRLVVNRCREGRALVLRRAVELVQQRLGQAPELLAAIEREAA